jgi:tRNA-specific 2-thiouridylase
MSGGVDSSVAAHLLRSQGHDLIGVFMRHGEESAEACRVGDGSPSPLLPILQGRADHKQGCCTASDAADARRVADALNIPFYALNLQKDFRRIVDYFVADYTQGRTPNPCVMCNNWIKFGKLFEFADGMDADFVATGHYARMGLAADGRPTLNRGRDSNKDQSYALFGVERHRLGRMLLPVGDFEKPEIRQMASDLGLGVAEKKDSQEICFVTQGHHSDFVRARRPAGAPSTAGEIVTVEGRVVGKHDGFEAFTIGQRKGLGVAMGQPYFVVAIEPDTRRVVIGEPSQLLRATLLADQATWLIDANDLPNKCQVQIRYNSEPQSATVTLAAGDSRSFVVQFDEPQAGVAPGQAAVVYDGDRVLGGGWILRTAHHPHQLLSNNEWVNDDSQSNQEIPTATNPESV